MPARRVVDPEKRGRECWQWGFTGKVYCGRGAKMRAQNQGRAIEANRNRKR